MGETGRTRGAWSSQPRLLGPGSAPGVRPVWPKIALWAILGKIFRYREKFWSFSRTKIGAHHVQFGPAGPGPRSQGCSGLGRPRAKTEHAGAQISGPRKIAIAIFLWSGLTSGALHCTFGPRSSQPRLLGPWVGPNVQCKGPICKQIGQIFAFGENLTFCLRQKVDLGLGFGHFFACGEKGRSVTARGIVWSALNFSGCA